MFAFFQRNEQKTNLIGNSCVLLTLILKIPNLSIICNLHVWLLKLKKNKLSRTKLKSLGDTKRYSTLEA